ncbi:MAG: ABC transporter permease [Clostridiales Family XIII bacterium]|jgi:hypothetical protein|nr:ABC transporter permease [Clostridiales Family XIII bacterium]
MKGVRLAVAIMLDDLRHFVKSGAFAVLAAALGLTGIACAASLPSSFFSSGSPPPVAIALVNPDEGMYAQALHGMLAELPEVSAVTWCSPDEAEALLAGGEVSVIAEIPDGMIDALIQGRHSEIRITALDPMSGASAYTMAVSAAKAMNTMQAAANAYRGAAVRYAGADADAFWEAYAGYTASLLGDAVFHRRFVEAAPDAADPYSVQLVSLLLFIFCCGGAMYVFAAFAGQAESGRLRRLSLRGVGPWRLFFVKLAQCFIVNIASCLLLVYAAGALDGFAQTSAAGALGGFAQTGAAGALGGFAQAGAAGALGGFAHTGAAGALGGFAQISGAVGISVAAALITAAVSPIFWLLSLIAPTARHMALASSAVALLCLFTGGGFYPAHLMNIQILRLNPAYLDTGLAGWLLGAGFPDIGAFSCMALPAAACLAAAVLIRRRASVC